MTGLASIGTPGTCPTCGSSTFAREDTIVKGGRQVEVRLWEDGRYTAKDESLDWEIDDASYGSWTCWPKNHPIPEDLADNLDEAADGAWN